MNLSRIARAIRGADRLPEVFRCRRETPDWWPLTRAYVGLGEISYPFEMRFRSGLRFTLTEPEDLATIWQVAFHQVYRLRPDDRYIVDVGANVGFFSCYSTSQIPELQILAVEPFPPNVARLQAAVGTNSLGGRIRVEPCAVAAKAGTVSMWQGDFPSQMARVFDEPRDNTVDIPAVPLSDIIDKADFPHIDLLKVDIEGSEFEVFDSIEPELLDSVRRLSVEYHCAIAGEGRTWRQLVDRLAPAGLQPIRTEGLDPDYDVIHFQRNGR